MDKCGLNPLAKISELLPQLDAKEQCHVMLQLLPYTFPKHRSVDLEVIAEANAAPQTFAEWMALAVRQKESNGSG